MFNPAGRRHKNSCVIAASRHQINAFYFRILTDLGERIGRHARLIRRHGNELDVQKMRQFNSMDGPAPLDSQSPFAGQARLGGPVQLNCQSPYAGQARLGDLALLDSLIVLRFRSR